MDRVQKFLARLQRKRRESVIRAIELIGAGTTANLDIKPLQGKPGHFRCRIGDIRILFVQQNGQNHVYAAGFRGDIY